MIAIVRKEMQSLISVVRSEGFKRYFTNTSWLFVDNTFNLIIGFAVGIMVARYLGARDFGLLNFAKSIAKFFSTICALGLEKIVIKKLVYEKDSLNQLLGTTLVLKMAAAIGSIVLISVFGLLIFEDSLSYQLILAFVAVTFFEAFVVIKFFFQSKVQSRFISRVVLYKIIISSFIKILIVYFKLPLIYFAYEALLEAFMGVVGYLYVYKKKSNHDALHWKFNPSYGRSLLKESWPLIVSSFVIYIYMEIDIVMIKYMLGNIAVGHYAIAVRLTSIWNMIGIVICSSLFPAVLNAKNKSETLYLSRFSNLLRMLVGISLFIVVAVFVLGGWAVPLLFGEEFSASVSSLQILIWTVIFVNLGMLGNNGI